MTGGDFTRLRALVDGHSFSADPEHNDALRSVAHRVVDKMQANTLPQPLKLESGPAVYTTVVCNDTPPPSTDVQWWVDQETAVYRDYPLVGIDDFRSCLYWSRPASVRQPSLDAMQGLDIMMLQAQYDGATPAEGARRTFARLPSAHMVSVSDEMTHGVYPYLDDCVDLTVARYLARQPTPQREFSCAGTPLEEDRLPANGLLRHALGAAGTYADPAAATAVAERMKAMLIPPGAATRQEP